MSYVGEEGERKGFDLEMLLMTAKALDVHVEFVGMDFAAILPYVQSGKALIGAGTQIDLYCMQNDISPKEKYRIRLVIEELLPASGRPPSG